MGVDQSKRQRESISKQILFWVEMNESVSIHMHHCLVFTLCLYPLRYVPLILLHTSELLVSLPPETPTLMNLLSFSERGVNIVEQIGVNYLMFGMILLQDDNGAIVKALEKEHRGNAEDISIAIFQKWLNGKGMRPVTWSTLVTALQKITTWK